MKKFTGVLLVGALTLTTLTTSVFADSGKGQKLYSKKLKKVCGMNGAKMAAKHSQDEWEEIGVKGLAGEIKNICPNIGDKALKDKYLKHYYDFFYKFANDSGEVPAC